MSNAHTSVCSPCSPVHLCVSRGFCIWYGDGETSVYPIGLGLGGNSSSVRHFGVCQYIHCVSLWVDSYWTGYFWMFLMPHAVVPFFVVPLCLRPLLQHSSDYHSPVTGVYSSLSFLSLVTVPPPWWGFLQHWVRVVWFCCHCWCQGALEVLLALPLCYSSNLHLHASSGLCQLCHGFSTGRFLFQSWVFHCFVYYMFGVCSGAMLDATLTYGGSTIGVCTLATLGAYSWQAYMQPGDGHWSTLGMHRVAASSTTLSRGSLLLLNQLFPSHPIYMVGHMAFGVLAESHLVLLPSLHGVEESSFPGLGPSDDMVDSVSAMGIKPVIRVWWLGIRWWVYCHLVSRVVCCSFPHLS